MKPNWIVDECILESRNVVGDLKRAIIDSGANLHSTRYIPYKEIQDYGHFNENDCVILYGTIGFIKKCKTKFNPGAYGVNNNTSCNVYYSHIPIEWMLNNDYILLPFSHVKDYTMSVFNKFKTTEFFIRPNSGFKTFTGQIIKFDNYEYELNSINQISSVSPETICLISNVQKIEGEFRFVIGDNEVIDGSEYQWDEKLDIRHDWPEDCLKLAEKIAKLPFQLDKVYTCDIALTEDGPKVIELNSFSSAGLYATDKDLIVNRINEIALKDFKGEF